MLQNDVHGEYVNQCIADAETAMIAGDFKRAEAKLTAALTFAPSIETYLTRAVARCNFTRLQISDHDWDYQVNSR